MAVDLLGEAHVLCLERDAKPLESVDRTRCNLLRSPPAPATRRAQVLIPHGPAGIFIKDNIVGALALGEHSHPNQLSFVISFRNVANVVPDVAAFPFVEVAVAFARVIDPEVILGTITIH